MLPTPPQRGTVLDGEIPMATSGLTVTVCVAETVQGPLVTVTVYVVVAVGVAVIIWLGLITLVPSDHSYDPKPEPASKSTDPDPQNEVDPLGVIDTLTGL